MWAAEHQETIPEDVVDVITSCSATVLEDDATPTPASRTSPGYRRYVWTDQEIGFAMGLNPWDSALKLGMGYAWTLFELANQTADRIWMAVALVIAAVAAR